MGPSPSFYGYVQISENPSLKELNIFENLETARGIDVTQNNDLLSLNSFNSLESISERFMVNDNQNLENILFPQLDLIEGITTISIVRNSGLQEIIIPELDFVGERLSISNNPKLNILNLSNGNLLELRSIAIVGNELLTDFCFLNKIIIRDFNPNNSYVVRANGYNPTFEELTNGNCKQ